MNVLDKFLPWMVERIEYARDHNITHFQIWHPTGDRILVMLTNGSVNARRLYRDTPLQLVELVTTIEQLRRDLKTGITSKQAEFFRG